MAILQIMVGGRVPLAIGEVAEVELLELLGIGGYGSAWKVVDTTTGVFYVLKIIQGIKPGSIEATRVRMEAEVSIPSEYIVPVVGLREWDPNTFLILFKYYPGESLDKLLERGALANDQKKRIFTQVLIGVSDAHRSNVIHRDLKPGNILVEEGGNVRIIDFGVSKFKGKGITLSGEIVGTIPYMAPELLTEGAKVADARADIYSLGHILYELAMGQHFWIRKGWRELKDLISYLTRTPPPDEMIELGDFHCDFLPAATRVIPRMVKLIREARYDSVDDVLRDLGYSPYVIEPPADLHMRSPLLIVESGSNRGATTVLGLKPNEVRMVGRQHLAGDDTSISRNHLEFSRLGDRYFVRDVGSKNGTMVRGIALVANDLPTEIHHADRIKVGDVFLRFAFLHEPAGAYAS